LWLYTSDRVLLEEKSAGIFCTIYAMMSCIAVCEFLYFAVESYEEGMGIMTDEIKAPFLFCSSSAYALLVYVYIVACCVSIDFNIYL
jgi:hypothetical protein